MKKGLRSGPLLFCAKGRNAAQAQSSRLLEDGLKAIAWTLLAVSCVSFVGVVV